ncbi:PEP-CTERM protein-sorting domain-containing protein [Verrucomicrobium sp. GAS474]|uniref:beta strand repeat-containing protein n=1 Tax=Verrucomicrobium sp. GAS474 TaxID=1882831 RepID=UPI00087B70F3|nr:PEP-CTERM sorting domain-containing protein [Verrucomicrobium sp. GAS474]SDU17913.1 PEP-CTERM protein-sorting domain-containing protein [Verrucomicrobium sp. GAS474]
MKIPSLLALSLVVFMPLGGWSQTTYTWAGASGSSWAAAANWSPTTGTGTTFPGAGDTAILGNVASGTMVSVYGSGSGGSLGTLSLVQSTSGATNELSVQSSLSVANSFTLGASAGTSLLYLDSYTANSALTLAVGSGTGTLTVASGGVLEFGTSLSGTTAAAGSTFSGNLSIAGGTVNVERGRVNFVAYPITISGAVSMSAGMLVIGSTPLSGPAGTAQDTRFSVTGNFIATGGSITTSLAKGYTSLYLNGGTNDLSGLTSFSTNIGISLSNSPTTTGTTSTQSLSIGSNSIGTVLLRNSTSNSTAVKTISSTTGTIGAITFDGHSGGASITLLLGSNLTLTTNAAMPTNSAYGAGSYTQNYIIDTASYVFDLSAGTNNGALAPANQSGTTTLVNWVMQGSGTVKAGSFDISNIRSSSILGSVTIQAAGGNGTANNLGNLSVGGSTAVAGTATGTISATSTFLYSGSATASSAATLVSNRTIGALAVQNGFLNIAQAALSTGGGVTLSSGGLQLNGVGTAGTITLASGQNFTMTGGTLAFDIGTAQDQVLSLGSGTFTISGGTLSLTLGTGYDYASAYTLFSGFTSGSVSGLAITGYDTADYLATLSSSGVLTFSAIAVPEPGPLWLLLLGASVLSVAARRRQTCQA